jgi:hypothetical protein
MEFRKRISSIPKGILNWSYAIGVRFIVDQRPTNGLIIYTHCHFTIFNEQKYDALPQAVVSINYSKFGLKLENSPSSKTRRSPSLDGIISGQNE